MPLPRVPVSFRVLPAVAVLHVLGPIGLAHETWFIDRGPYPVQWGSAFGPPNLWFVLAAILGVGAAGLLWRLREGRDFLGARGTFGSTMARRRVLFALVPPILGVHLAVPLVILGITGYLFVPAVALETGWQNLLGLAQVGIALSLFYGGLTRIAAGLLAVLWLIGLGFAGPTFAGETLHVLGFAAFFLFAGRGPIAVDRLLFPRLEPPASLVRVALVPLRVGVGLSFVVVAFSEKLANVPLGEAFLDAYHWNVAAALGLPVSDATFILAAGTVELAIGLLLVFGIFVRETILLAWLPFNLTLTVLDWMELVGHLPIYGVMAVLLVWTPGGEDERVWMDGVRSVLLPVDDTQRVRRSSRS